MKRLEARICNIPDFSSRGIQRVAGWFTGAKDRPAPKVPFSQDGGKSFGSLITMEAEAAAGFEDVLLRW